MTDRTDDILWMLSTQQAEVENEDMQNPATAEPVSVETLLAYRSNAMDEREAERVELALAADPTLRRKLAELAGVEPLRVSTELRQELLGELSAPDPTRRNGGSASSGRLVAAIVVAALAAGAIYVGFSTRSDPTALAPHAERLEYAVRVEAESATRSTTGDTQVAAATRVRIYVEPTETPEPGVLFALYRVEAGALIRVPETDLSIETVRGAAEITVEGRALADGPAGPRELFVVVALEGDRLPERVARMAGGDPAKRLTGDGRYVHAHPFFFVSTP